MPHIHELNDYTVSVFIVHDGRVLMVDHPRYDKWLPIGGHIELDEDPEQALYREVQEESGLAVEIMSNKPAALSPGHKFLLTPNFLDVHEANSPHHHIAFVYFARAHDDTFTKSDEHRDMRWLTSDDLVSPVYNLSQEVLFYANAALDLAASA